MEEQQIHTTEIKPQEEKEEKKEQPMGDVYDVYAKAVGVHSKMSGMTEDYTLTNYSVDIYNLNLPKFIREQRKVLRIIKSYLILPMKILRQFYNNEQKAKQIQKGLKHEYDMIEELILGEIDECVIMGRTPKGQVIDAFLKHGLNQNNQEEYDTEIEQPTPMQKLKEKR